MQVENHEVACDALESPVVVRSEQLPHTRHPYLTVDRRQQNRPVAGDAKRPERLLPEPVLFDRALGWTESRMREHQMARQILIQRCVSWRDSQIAQLGLCLSPGQVERAPCAVGIVIEIGELDRPLFLIGDERRECDVRRPSRRNSHLHSQREYRIQYRAHRSAQLGAFVESLGISHRPSATDELCSIGLTGDFAYCLRPACHHMCTPDRGFSCRARTTCRQQRRFCVVEFRLHEKIAKRWMRAVRVGRGQHHLRITRQLDFLRLQ